MEGGGKGDADESPTNSQQTISEDDEIDYSVKPEFYDPDLDDKDEKWIEKKRNGRATDAVLSCPACFTTLCLECQRHEKYVTQYRAIFVMNCEVMKEKAHPPSSAHPKSRKRGRGSTAPDAHPASGETLKQVCCSICSTEVGVIDEEEIYHFYNALPSES
ncbi:hypothetical protein BT93_D1974 [Corymbia citriodora subsp. variegata]|nr:hypothetical protein BT93_D1974 [Corymbia citriodora subsp. variegata]